MNVRTRFAPSPTGLLHIGGVRTALFCWLYARRHGGTFILRVEDTDRERSTPEAVQVILDGMKWLGLDADEGPFYQTERYPRYREVIRQWLAEGRAYHDVFDYAVGMKDVQAAVTRLRSRPECNGRVGVMGFCLGGTMAYLSVARTDADAAVSYYGTRKDIKSGFPAPGIITLSICLRGEGERRRDKTTADG